MNAPRAAAIPARSAEPYPRASTRTTRAPSFSAISTDPSVDPLSAPPLHRAVPRDEMHPSLSTHKSRRNSPHLNTESLPTRRRRSARLEQYSQRSPPSTFQSPQHSLRRLAPWLLPACIFPCAHYHGEVSQSP